MLKFYLLLAAEMVLSPILYIKEYLKKYIDIPDGPLKKREAVKTNNVLIGIHDWAGYELKRKKTVNNIEFDCGLEYQLSRFSNYKGSYKTNISLTISDYDENRNGKKYTGLNPIAVSNTGMDFQGYAYTIQSNTDAENCYVLLMNSSVDAKQVDFLDNYIAFLEQNPHVGLLGISYSARMYQTVIRNNFTPHVQSFFLLTTLNVLKEVIDYNGGKFPGSDVSHKRMLIRSGEIRLSKIINKLGYQLAIITEEQKPFIFPKTEGWFNTAYSKWELPMGEYRFYVKHPNRITPITNS